MRSPLGPGHSLISNYISSENKTACHGTSLKLIHCSYPAICLSIFTCMISWLATKVLTGEILMDTDFQIVDRKYFDGFLPWTYLNKR